MNVTSLSLVHFRNAERETLSFDRGVNLIYGANAQGKTNVIEALYYLSAAKSFRFSKERDMIAFGQERGELSAAYEKEGISGTIGAVFSKKENRKLFLNGRQLDKMSEFFGNFRAVLFTPEHLSLVKGGPAGRRAFVDGAICQLRPVAVSLFFEYNRLLGQRTALLKLFRQGQRDDSMEVWNDRLALCAARITVLRREYLRRLKGYGQAYYAESSAQKEAFSLHYESGVPPRLEKTEEIRQWYRQIYERTLENDVKNAQTSCGVHRDDVAIRINGQNARVFASQGQQRSAVLSLKLAEGDLCREESGIVPLYLFDDVFSELDRERRRFIAEKIEGKQVIITACDREDSSGLSRIGKRIKVENGRYQ